MSSGQSKQKKKTDVPSKRASDTITAKDERVKQPRVDTVKSREKTADESSGAGTPTSAKPVIARRLPGSGFKAKAGSLTPTPPAHDPIRAGSQPPKRSAQSDVRDVKMEVSSPLPSSISLSRSSLPSTSVSQAPASHALPKKPKDPQGTTATPRTQESREKDRKVSPSQSSTSTAGFKRKPKEEPDSEYSERDVSNGSTMLKRRKIGDGQPLRDRQQKEGDRGREREYESERPPERMKGKERDPSLPKKPVMQDASSMPPPRMTRIKREGSPISVKRSPHPPTRSPLPPAHSPTPSTSGRSPLPPSTHSPIPSNRSPMPYGRSPLVSHQSPAKPSVADRTVSGSSSLHKRTSSGAKAADRERENERGRDRERPAHAHRANGSAKPRRKSPIYTSSEDESSHPSAPDPTSSAALRRGVDGGGDDSARSISTSSSLSSGPPAKSKMLSRRTKKPLELPDTAEGLRKLYEAKYPKYMKLFYQHFEAVHTIKRMLSKDLDEATDSEIDAELLSPDQILMLKEEFETAERELKMIRNAHAKLRKVTAAGTGSDVE